MLDGFILMEHRLLELTVLFVNVLSVKILILVSCVSFPVCTGMPFCHCAVEWDWRPLYLGPRQTGRSMMAQGKHCSGCQETETPCSSFGTS